MSCNISVILHSDRQRNGPINTWRWKYHIINYGYLYTASIMKFWDHPYPCRPWINGHDKKTTTNLINTNGIFFKFQMGINLKLNCLFYTLDIGIIWQKLNSTLPTTTTNNILHSYHELNFCGDTDHSTSTGFKKTTYNLPNILRLPNYYRKLDKSTTQKFVVVCFPHLEHFSTLFTP